jgi:hypothetical protein
MKKGVGVVIMLAVAITGCRRRAPRADSTSQVFDSQARSIPADAPRITFQDVSRQAGIDFIHSGGPRTHQLPEDMGSGLAWGDYNNDGCPDVYIVNQQPTWGAKSSQAGGRLYRNNCDGTFTDVTQQAGVSNPGGFGMGAYWGDYDNDGNLDLYITNYGRSVLYHNNGNGTFTDVTDRAGVANNAWGTGAVWFDYDHDGYLDLYVTNYVQYDLQDVPAGASSEQYGVNVPFTLNPQSFPPTPNRLYHNNHDGTFTDVAQKLGVADASGRSLTVAATDFNLDGWPDLYIGNDISSTRLYLNLHGHGFKDVSASSWTEENRGSMGIATGDFDGDGDLDMFVTHWLGQGDALYQNLWFEDAGNAKGLHFTDTADYYGCGSISMPTVGWATFFFDFDNDGRLDLFVANGSTIEDKADTSRLIPAFPFLFWNKGTQGFYELATAGALGEALRRPLVARGAGYADFDNDGALDLLITTNHGRPLLLRNVGSHRNHWLSIHLTGTRSNREGLGARLVLESAGRRMLREYGSNGAYLSQSVPEAWFGLGGDSHPTRLTVYWPSGAVQTITAPPVDRELLITEGRRDFSQRLPRPH